MGKRDTLTIVCIVGLTCLCALISLCSYPGTLLGNVDHALYRSFNQAFIASYAATSIGYGYIGLRIAKRTTLIVANVAFAFLALGLLAAEGMGVGQDARLPIVVGLFVGMGLSVTTVFWLTLLSTLPERTAILSQGLQMALGSLLFAFIASIFGKMSWTVSVLLCLVSWVCMIVFLKKSGRMQLKDLPQKSHARTDLRRTFAILIIPLAGFALVSFIFGIVEVVAMGSGGSPNGGIASYWGGPLGALAFLIWAYLSSSRNYEKALRAIFFMFAFAFVIPVFDVTVFLMSVGFSAGSLLLISRIIDEFSADKRMTSGLIALSLAVSKGMLLAGLYVPGWFGVRSHAAYYQSTSLPLFMVYLVFVMILLFESKKLDVSNLSGLVSALFRIKDLAKGRESTPGSRNDEIDAVCRLLAYDFRLTKREAEILGYLARGRDKTFICEQLHLSRNTVKGYTKSLYRKLDIHSHQEVIDKIESVKVR